MGDMMLARSLNRFVAVVLVTLVGCTDRALNEVSVHSQPANKQPPKPSSIQEFNAGMIRTRTEVEHDFRVVNNSSTEWRLQSVINTCSCLVTSLSNTVVPAGGSTHVKVRLTAGTEPSDERRRVILVFDATNPQSIALDIIAQVRDAITVNPQRIMFHSIGKGRSAEANFEVHNFSDSRWDSVLVEPLQPWITVSTSAMQNTPAGDVRPLQRWRVLVKANTEGLNPGNHASDISIRAVGAKDIATLLPVSANVVSPVRAIPAQFFFGLVKPNASVTRRIKFYFSDDTVPDNHDSIAFVHSLDTALTLEWVTTTGTVWELQATLTPTRPVTNVTVRVTFADPLLGPIDLPVYAILDESDRSLDDAEN